MSMSDRDVFLQTVRHERPERILSRIPSYELYYKGCHHEGPDGLGHNCAKGTSWKDIWGVGWHKDLDGVMGFPREHPLKDLEALDSFKFPDPDDEACFGQIFEMKAAYDAQGLSEQMILSGSHRDTLWERAYMLVGMEDMMVAFYTEPGLAKRLLSRIMDFQMRMAAHYVRAGIQMASLGDDMGTQSGLLLGESIFDEFLLPEYRRLMDFYKAHGVLIYFHSCGHVEPLLERFIDLGISILNPVQASANDLDSVRAKTKGRLTLHGGVDSQVLMEGSREEIEALVRARMKQLGGEGGYVCAPDQYMPYPEENLRIWEETVRAFG